MNILLRPSIHRYLHKTVHILIIALVILFGFRAFLLEPSVTDGRSMEPTLVDHDFVFTNKWALLFREPRRGEIVQIRQTQLNEVVIKRIIGLPGERVKLKNGDVYILDAFGNEERLTEPYLNESEKTFSTADTNMVSAVLLPHQYYVLGDHRTQSTDSRAFGPVHRSSIYGTVLSLPFLNKRENKTP